MKVAFITPMSSHYRVKTFETLARYYDTDYYFFSSGQEWYYQREHGLLKGDFNSVYLPGVQLGNTRLTPTLPLKLLQTPYDVYIKCINGKFALPASYAVARLKRKPFILWTGIWTRLQTPIHRLFYPLTRHIYTHADAIVVYGEHVKQFLINEGVAAERIFTTTHAVDNEIYQRAIPNEEKAALRASLDIAPHQRVLLFVGRLVADKGLNYLIEALSQLQRDDVVLVFVGSGSETQSLTDLAASLGVSDRVRFTGYIPATETVRYYSISDALILPSITTPLFKEPWGLVVNEAFNQGVPVIATDAVGAAAGGLVRNGETGFVVRERNSAALAEAIQQLLQDPDLYKRLSTQARTTMQQWDNDHMVLGFRQAIAYVTHQSEVVMA